MRKFIDELTSELFGALGLLSSLKLRKKITILIILTPKILIRYSIVRKKAELDPLSAFGLNRISNLNNYETGLSTTIGFDYDIKDKNKKLIWFNSTNNKRKRKQKDG